MNTRRAPRLLPTIVAALVAALPAGARGVDAGFGNGGWLRVGGDYTTVAGIAVRPDGRIVVLGMDGRLQQRLADGRLDRSFPTHAIAGAIDGCCAGAFLALQPDGKVLTVANGPHGTLARYTTTGRIDTSFGAGGRLSLGDDFAAGIVVARDGKIIVGVGRSDGAATTGGLIRLLPDGQPDTSFGPGGRIGLPAGVVPVAVAAETDGGILVAGRGQAVSRYRNDGSRDDAFASHGGTAIEGLAGGALAVQSDDRIVVAGVRIAPGAAPETDVVRLLPDGRPDPRFGAGGVVVAFKRASGALIGLPEALAALPDGGVAVAGVIHQTCACKGADWLALRIAADGTVRSVPPPGGADPDHDCWGGEAGAVAVQPDGKLLFGGDMCDRGDSSGSSTFVGRFNPASLGLDAGPALHATLSNVHVRFSGNCCARDGDGTNERLRDGHCHDQEWSRRSHTSPRRQPLRQQHDDCEDGARVVRARLAGAARHAVHGAPEGAVSRPGRPGRRPRPYCRDSRARSFPLKLVV